MATERTLSIIKPDATARNLIGKILSRFEENGLKIVAGRYMRLSSEQAAKFYEVHKERPFYHELVEYMTSGPIFVSALEGENAIAENRRIMGATNPEKADPGTIRKDFALGIQENSVHGSDAPDTARNEIAFFFPELK